MTKIYSYLSPDLDASSLSCVLDKPSISGIFNFMKLIDLTGEKFGRLLVIEKSIEKTKSGQTRWICKCDCGITKIISGFHLTGGDTQSCGCLAKELTSKRSTIHGHAAKKNSTPEYRAYYRMMDRCYRTNNKSFHRYGGRGIIVCERWKTDFLNFYNDMGERPSSKHSLDRYPDVNGNYEPGNCRWATAKEQAGNKTTNTWYEYKGERMILADWARKLNVDVRKLHAQIKRTSFEDYMNIYTQHGLIDRRKMPKLFYKNPARYFLGKTGKDHHNSRPVKQLDKMGNLINEFDSIASAQKATGINNIHIPLKDTKRTAGGYKWEYA